MLVIHNRFRYQGRPKFGGVLQPGDEVLHLVSDAGTEDTQRSELREFVVLARLPRSLLNNPHFLKPGRPHLDVWGGPAKKTARLLEAAGSGRPERPESAPLGGRKAVPQVEPPSQNPRISTCIPGAHERQCVVSGRRRHGVRPEESNGGKQEAWAHVRGLPDAR